MKKLENIKISKKSQIHNWNFSTHLNFSFLSLWKKSGVFGPLWGDFHDLSFSSPKVRKSPIREHLSKKVLSFTVKNVLYFSSRNLYFLTKTIRYFSRKQNLKKELITNNISPIEINLEGPNKFWIIEIRKEFCLSKWKNFT